jgi:4-amino-4-deoxy-L-arabinose transferase-like glycosyltransferase
MKEFFNNHKILLILSSVYLIIHLIFINNYDYFRDELYYIACANHLAFGFIDHPPFVALIVFLETNLLGNSLIALRISSAIAGALTVLITGLMVKEIGGSVFTQILASICTIFSPVYLFLFHIISMNSFDIMFWTLALYILIKIIKSGNPKYWLWFGIIIGFGFQNKLSILFLLLGLGAGLILTPNRKYILNKYFWFGAAIAFIISLPNIIWQAVNGFPTIEFMRNASTLKNASISPLDFMKEQMLQAQPASFILMPGGLYWVFFTKTGKPYRLLGWIYLVILVFFISTTAKVYYLSPVYTVMFALGAVSLEQFVKRFNAGWLKPVVLTILIILGAATAPLTLPVFPVDDLIAYSKSLGMTPSAGERSRLGELPQYYADMFGWRNMAEQVAKVYNTLTTEEQKHCGILAMNYGEAGAIDFFGKDLGLPHAICGHNSYWH